MLLLEKKRLIEQQFDSKIIITAFEEDKASVVELMTELNVVGLNYTYLEKSKNIQEDYWYWKACEDNLKKASCMVMVMSKSLFLPENAKRLETFWYEAGYLEARCQIIIPYFVNMNKSEIGLYLEKMPIRQMQATNNTDEVIAKIELIRTYKKSFFHERNIALYGNSRVFYSKLSVLFNLNKDFLDNILKRIKILNIEDIQTNSDVLSLLQKELNFGVRLFRFGKDCFTKHPYYSAYKEETEILNIDSNAINIENRFAILSQNFNDGSAAIKVDFIFPNHEIFGVSIKPYVEITKNSIIRKNDLISIIIIDNGTTKTKEKTDITFTTTDKAERMYFNFYFGDDNFIINCEDDVLGKYCNYIYAK